jgi:TRAP-type C4-dicarboxylate transport system permease small subunit
VSPVAAVIEALLGRYERAVRWVSDVTLWLCVAALVGAVTLNAIEIAGRYFFGDSSLYRVEVSLELCVAMYFVGYLVLLGRSEDVAMGYFYDRLPRRARLILDVAIAAGTTWFFGVLLESSLAYFRLTSTMTHPTFPISRGITTLPILAAAAGCLWIAIYQVLASVRDLVANWNRIDGPSP